MHSREDLKSQKDLGPENFESTDSSESFIKALEPTFSKYIKKSMKSKTIRKRVSDRENYTRTYKRSWLKYMSKDSRPVDLEILDRD